MTWNIAEAESISDSLRVYPVDNLLVKGSPLCVKLSYKKMDNFCLVGWQLYGYEPDLPDKIQNGGNVFLRRAAQKKWNCYLFGTKTCNWLKKTDWEKNEHAFSLSTDTWPVGDYKTGISLVFRNNSGKQIIVRRPLFFSLKEPGKGDAKVIRNGLPDDEFFRNIPWRTNFKPLLRNTKLKAQTRFKITSDENNLYLLAEALEPEMEKLVLTPKCTRDNISIWKHDNIELDISPDTTGNYFYKIIVDADGTYLDYLMQDDNTGQGIFQKNKNWDSRLQVKTERKKDRYIIKLKIPFAVFDYSLGNTGEWRFNIARARYAGLSNGQFELSTFVKLSKATNDVPWEYEKIKFPQFKPNKYRWAFSNPRGNTTIINGKLNYSVQIDITNSTGQFRNLNAEANLSGKNYSEKQGLTFGARSDNFKTIEFNFKDIPESGDYLMTINIVGLDGQLLKTWQNVLPVVCRPITIKLLNPAYRNNIYATMPDKRIRAQITIAGYLTPSAIRAELSGKGFKTVKNIPVHKQSANVEFAAAALADGTYELSVYADSNGQVRKSTVKIKKLPYMDGEVWLDRYGIVRINGKRFLPFGWFRYGADHKTFDTVFQSYARYQSIKEFDDYFDNHGKRTGRKGILFPYQEMTGSWPYKYFNGSQRMGALTDKQKEILEKFVSGAKKRSHLLGWYLADEPEMRDENPKWYESVYELIKENDPYHPAIMLNCTLPGIKEYKDACDILFPDFYPDYYQSETRQPIRMTSTMTSYAVNYRPTWVVVQAFSWLAASINDRSPGRPPTLTELRNQIYQVFANDGKGVFMYDFYHTSQMFASTRLGPEFMAEEVYNAHDYLLDPNINNSLKVITKPHSRFFQAALKTLDGRICLIAVNTDNKKLTATFSMKASKPKILYVLSENRAVKLVDGEFSDTFEPLAAHIYINSKPIAGKTDIKTTEQRIAAFNKARVKAGNLVATGELRLLDYYNSRKGIFPPGSAKIRASSEILHYFTSKTGTLLYLFDGICEVEPRDPHMCWRPLPGDKKPWLDITLPQKALVEKVILYPVQKVVLNGKTVAEDLRIGTGCLKAKVNNEFKIIGKFEKSTSDILEIKFQPIKTSELKLEFESPNIGLSEVEVFGKVIEKTIAR